jgi:hypothetical protein
MVDSDSRFHFVPFANQGEPKIHFLEVPIKFPPLTRDYESTCGIPQCRQQLKLATEDYVFAWGNEDEHRLECVVRNTPQLKCSNAHLFLPPEAAIPIQHKAYLIRDYFEFPEVKSLGKLMKMLSPDNLLKVLDFTIDLRQDPLFMLDRNEQKILAHLQKIKA